MAKQVINIGSAPNDNTGDFIRDAFDKCNDNFTELYTDDAGDVGSITATAPIERDSATGAVTISLADGGISTAKIADDAVTADKLANSINTEITANTAKVTNATHTGDVTGSGALTIATDAVVTAKILNDNVTHDKLEGRYTALQTITTTSGTINLDGATYAAFNLTGTLTTATLNIQNLKKGQVIDILLSGTLSSAVITLADSFTTSTINKVGTTALDQSATNIIQVLCVDDNDGAAILTYAIATYAVDTTP